MTLQEVMASCRPLIDAGAALHWLRPRSKAPVEDAWSTAAVYTASDLSNRHRSGYNIGIRLGEPSKTASGYVHVLDVDIRKPELAHEAWAKVKELVGNPAILGSVISGSGGESRHVYFFSEKPLKSRKIAKSNGFSHVFDPKLGREVKKNDWEIDLFGTGKQVAMPPSIHPDTGKPYVWEREIDWLMVELGCEPCLDTSLWNVESADSDAEDDDDDLFALVRAEPLDVSTDEVDRYIESLPEEWVEDRDSWLTVGAGLSHQYQGSQIGFEKWCEWSKQSAKFNMRDQKAVWKSFKGAKNPITFRSVIAAAQDNVLQQNLPAIRVEEEYDPLMELLGESLPEKVKVNPIADWTSYLARNEDGAPTGCLHNAKLIIENDARTFGVIAFNSFKGNIVLVNEPRLATRDREHVKKQMVQLEGHLWKVKDPVNGRDISDSHAYELRMMVEAPKGQGGYGIKLTDRDLYAAIDVVANKNRYHPIRNYLESCFASRSSREAVQTLFIRYLGCDDTPYHRECAELLMVGAVARIFEPGHKFDFVPILEGLQGKRKSTFVETLSNGWTAQLTLDFQNTNRMIEQIQGAWLVEIAELQGFSKSDANDLKGFVSQKFDKGRLAYKRNAEVFPRQCVFIGTTNEEEYLRDATGGRRFWPITCNLPEDQEIDIDALRAEADSLWGAAVAIYREMRQTCKLPDLPLYIRSEAAKAEAKALQESRRLETVEDSLAGTIQKWLEEPIGTESGFDDLDPDVPAIYRTETCIMQVWTELMGNEPGRLNTAESIKIGRALGRIEGWVRSKHQIRTERFGRQRVYFEGQTRNTSEL